MEEQAGFRSAWYIQRGFEEQIFMLKHLVEKVTKTYIGTCMQCSWMSRKLTMRYMYREEL